MRSVLKSFKRSMAIGLVVLASATSAQAQNATVNFDALTSPTGTRFIQNCYVESGFRFTAVGIGCNGTPSMNAFLAGNQNSPGFSAGMTPSLMLNSPTATAIDVMRVDGAPFALVSIGLAPFDMAATNVQLIGTFLGGGTVSLSQPLLASQTGLITVTAPGTFSGLSSLRIQATNEFGEPYVIVDNLAANVSTNMNVVPEPSTYLLMAAGLGGIALVARRRRAA